MYEQATGRCGRFMLAYAIALCQASCGDPAEPPVLTCDWSPPGPVSCEAVPFVRVVVPADQPSSETLGKRVLIQQAGGSQVRVATVAGTHLVSSEAVSAQTSSCITVPHDWVSLPMVVVPDDRECWLFVDLLGPNDDAGKCTGMVLDSAIVVVAAEPQNAGPEEGETGVEAGADGGLDAPADGSGGESDGATSEDAAQEGPPIGDAGGGGAANSEDPSDG